ncbi:hypothetical protein F5051DRAFT_32752 [Lentinula edodes]|nr:hypothetical protein F5051DRAFT_32752 [Lentinula edodes]
MQSLSLKLLVISVISLTILVVVNASPTLKPTHLTAGHNGESRLIGYLFFLHENEMDRYKQDGKIPDLYLEDQKNPFFLRPIYSHPASKTYHVCKVLDTNHLLEGVKEKSLVHYTSNTLGAPNTFQDYQHCVVVTPVHPLLKQELQMDVPKAMLKVRPPTVDCSDNGDRPVANWLDLNLHLPNQYIREVKMYG